MKYYFKYIKHFLKNWKAIKKGIHYTIVHSEGWVDESMELLKKDFSYKINYKTKTELTPELKSYLDDQEFIDINKLLIKSTFGEPSELLKRK